MPYEDVYGNAYFHCWPLEDSRYPSWTSYCLSLQLITTEINKCVLNVLSYEWRFWRMLHLLVRLSDVWILSFHCSFFPLFLIISSILTLSMYFFSNPSMLPQMEWSSSTLGKSWFYHYLQSKNNEVLLFGSLLLNGHLLDFQGSLRYPFWINFYYKYLHFLLYPHPFILTWKTSRSWETFHSSAWKTSFSPFSCFT